ncbi:type II secretion system ATPase GspE [bacterium]|nr:MAG: type II secretion system ATPase GspE [bacterium]QQR62329.1 MAG: type II secretion system ATPase GspE [bacterium]QQR63383.1 MAG: type II secretion system ATPase GspE [bacterium]
MYDFIIKQGFATAETIAQAYAAYAGLSVVQSINDEMADLTLLAKVPLKFLRDNVIMPIKKDGAVLVITADPMNFQPLDELNMLMGGSIEYAVATPALIIGSINKYYPLEGTKEVIEELEEEADATETVALEDLGEKDILTMATEAPIIKLVNHILFQAVKQGASDIHIEPFEKEMRVRYRIDGVMYDSMTPPKRIQGALVSRIKIMSNLNIAEKRIPQDGRIAIKVADKAIDLRVSILPVVYGERIVMRLLDKSKTFGQLEDLNMSDRDLKIMLKNVERPNGIIYVTGPTGSGKTSTLYSILGKLNQPDVNIITVEDPVEYQMSGIGQVQVKEKVGMTFAAALRSILRQDPDIVMIGETRDQETAQIAIQAALTGHLVLSTLHTNSAPASITRLIDMGIEPFLIASSVVVVLAQRLIRTLCNDCKKQYVPSADLCERVGLTKDEASKITFYEPVGCEQCSQLGYRGRRAIFEVMEMTPGVAALTMQRADTAVLRQKALQDGMTMLVADGLRAIKFGLTTIEEVLSVATIEMEAEPEENTVPVAEENTK